MQNKPIDIRMELAKQEIVEALNKVCEDKGLPLYLLNIIVNDITKQVNELSQQELQNNMNNYLKEQEAKKKNENKKDGDKSCKK